VQELLESTTAATCLSYGDSFKQVIESRPFQADQCSQDKFWIGKSKTEENGSNNTSGASCNQDALQIVFRKDSFEMIHYRFGDCHHVNVY
jgi:hypothetical protein